MTTNELRIEVCKLMGWINIQLKEGEYEGWNGFFTRPIPELTLDLMHEAEKLLTLSESYQYQKLVGWHDTAIEKATAFIAVKGKK